MDHDWFWVAPTTTLPFLKEIQTYERVQKRKPLLFLKEIQTFRFIARPQKTQLLFLKEIQEFRFKSKPAPVVVVVKQAKKFTSFIVLACILRINR